jgi:hypothetical protein
VPRMIPRTKKGPPPQLRLLLPANSIISNVWIQHGTRGWSQYILRFNGRNRCLLIPVATSFRTLRPRKLQVYVMYCILLRPTAREASDGGRAQAPFKPTPFGSDFTTTKLSQDRQGGAWTSGAKIKQTFTLSHWRNRRNPCHFQPLDLHRDKWGERFSSVRKLQVFHVRVYGKCKRARTL